MTLPFLGFPFLPSGLECKGVPCLLSQFCPAKLFQWTIRGVEFQNGRRSHLPLLLCCWSDLVAVVRHDWVQPPVCHSCNTFLYSQSYFWFFPVCCWKMSIFTLYCTFSCATLLEETGTRWLSVKKKKKKSYCSYGNRPNRHESCAT